MLVYLNGLPLDTVLCIFFWSGAKLLHLITRLHSFKGVLKLESISSYCVYNIFAIIKLFFIQWVIRSIVSTIYEHQIRLILCYFLYFSQLLISHFSIVEQSVYLSPKCERIPLYFLILPLLPIIFFIHPSSSSVLDANIMFWWCRINQFFSNFLFCKCGRNISTMNTTEVHHNILLCVQRRYHQ